jgi:serine protease Do
MRALVLPACLAAVCVAAPALAQPPLPQLPGPGSAPAPAPASQPSQPPAAYGQQAAAAVLPTAAQLYEHVRRGVVAIERNGVPVAIGTVLGNDGRILTALSGLAGGEGADVRYADGTSVHAKVGHSDRDNDLALLVPLSGRWTDGLSASEADPTGADLRAMLPTHGPGAHLGPAPVGVKGHVDAHARDGAALLQMLDLDLKGPLVAGAPLLDTTGSVVGVLVRACKGGPVAAVDSPWAGWGNAAQPPQKPAACNPVVLGAPVTAIRSFLSHTPPGAVAPAPWLGIRGDTATEGSTHGVRVTAVAPQSPADKAGLHADKDLIVAVDGAPVATTEALSQAIGRHAPGESVKLLVFGDGRFRELTVALRAAP